MRRKDRELKTLEEMMEVLRACKVCRMAMVDGERPYVLPLNFGAEREGDGIAVYLHCAKEGRKLEILRRNPRVCLEMDCEHGLIEAEKACNYGYTFASVLGEGTAEILEDPAEQRHGLTVLMEQQTGKHFSFTDAEASAVAVLRVRLAASALTGKRHAR